MVRFRFDVGQQVALTPPSGRWPEGPRSWSAADLFTVTRQLPSDTFRTEYRVRHNGSGQERVAEENDMHLVAL